MKPQAIPFGRLHKNRKQEKIQIKKKAKQLGFKLVKVINMDNDYIATLYCHIRIFFLELNLLGREK
ncbi:MAG: hypothetical protein LWW97_06090 [Deltaproteobacteria bacterium]|nr:hypothetical protein [Deltaproteobacteria bacterium]